MEVWACRVRGYVLRTLGLSMLNQNGRMIPTARERGKVTEEAGVDQVLKLKATESPIAQCLEVGPQRLDDAAARGVRRETKGAGYV